MLIVTDPLYNDGRISNAIFFFLSEKYYEGNIRHVGHIARAHNCTAPQGKEISDIKFRHISTNLTWHDYILSLDGSVGCSYKSKSVNCEKETHNIMVNLKTS